MTIVYVNNKKIKVYGHSRYDIAGKDIVCAAISSLIQSAYRYLLVTNNKINLTEDDGLFEIELKELNDSGKSIINEMVLLFKELEEQYPSNIYVRSELIYE